MRISDWSSDVCSSDLDEIAFRGDLQGFEATEPGLAEKGLHATASSDGRLRGAWSRTASAMAAICAGVVPQPPPTRFSRDRTGVVEGERVSVRVDLGGRRIIKKKKDKKTKNELK